MANLVRRKQVDQSEFSGFFTEVGGANYYPKLTNPSGYLLQSDLTTATGTVNNTINSVSGVLNTRIIATGVYIATYSDGVSGALSTRLISSGSSLQSSISGLSGYVVTTSGNLRSTISGASGVLDVKINTNSGYLQSYVDTISGVLNTKISTSSSASDVNSIVSGANFHFTGAKIFDSQITTTKVSFSGILAPTSISVVASSGVVSIVGTGGTFVSFFETGTDGSLWAVTNSAGFPMIELFNDQSLILGLSSRKSITLSGLSGYVSLPNLPTQAQTGGLPSGVIFRSGNYLMII